MTDAEFEKLDAQMRRYIERDHSGRRIPNKLTAHRVRCRDCDRPDPEGYQLKGDLWLKALPGGRGRLCLACLTKRLGRPLVAEDFVTPPEDFGDLPHRDFAL